MAGGLYLNCFFGRLYRRLYGIFRRSQGSFCKNKVKCGHHLIIGFDGRKFGSGGGREGGEDPHYLFVFPFLLLPEAVVLVDDRGRFDEKGLPRLGSAVYYARHAAFELASHRDHGAPVSRGHDSVREEFAVG